MYSFTSVLEGGEWSASRRGRFTPRERVSGAHLTGGLGGPQSRSGRSDRGRESNPRTPIVQPIAQRYTD
jgi:hypothetical protein